MKSDKERGYGATGREREVKRCGFEGQEVGKWSEYSNSKQGKW